MRTKYDKFLTISHHFEQKLTTKPGTLMSKHADFLVFVAIYRDEVRF